MRFNPCGVVCVTAFLVWAGAAGQALAAAAPLPPTATAVPVWVAACPIPYAVGEASTSSQISARLAVGSLKVLKGSPDLNANAGREILRSAYAGMKNEAMQAVAQAYACRINAYIDAQALPDPAAKKMAVTVAVAQLTAELGFIANAAQNNADLALQYTRILSMTTRPPDSPVLDTAIYDAALATVDPGPMFLSSQERSRWIQANITGLVRVGACDQVVRAAISDGTSSLQTGLAQVKSILRNYLDAATPPLIASAAILNSLSVSPAGSAVPPVANVRSCMAALDAGTVGWISSAAAQTAGAKPDDAAPVVAAAASVTTP